jgi:hypothetical protein
MNPYRTIMSRKAEKGVTKLKGQSNPFMNNSGEINASSQQDLIGQIGQILATYQGAGTDVIASSEAKRAKKQERSQVLAEAMASKDPSSMQMLGEAIVAEIRETSDREGFARRILQFNQINYGESNEVTLKVKDVMGFIATSSSKVTPTEIRQRRQIPPEFHLNGFILIDTAEIARSSSDILEEKYEEGLEAIMVQEDRLWKRIADQSATVRNTYQTFSTFTPAVFARQIDQVSRWGIPATSCLFSSSLWQDIIANGDFAGVLDPVTKFELLQTGFLGTMYGVEMITDNFRQPNLKVLETGEIFITGAPINHGVIVVRGDIVAEPVNKFSEGSAQRGWFIDQLTSLIMANSASVAKGKKV